jgi:hypothetical protein
MKRQIISTEVWVFITVLVIVIIAAVIYSMLAVDRPTDLQKFNELNPFPTIKMEHIPSPKFLTKNPNIKDCTQQVLPCKTDNDCTQECGANFTCTPIEDAENLVYNGIRVGKGNWCLPKNKLQGCGKYTGQVVWSGEESGVQDWQCICKYPSLFGGPEDPYCLKNLACQDPNDEAQGINQNNNKLTNSEGQVYDPNLPDFYPPNSVANPYALDKDGNPIYTCRCGTGSNNKRFVSLPNDPQGCNLDPCTTSHTSPLWDEENQTCICNIDGVVRKDSVCQGAACPYGSWNPLTQQCDCLGQLGKMRCNPEDGEPIWQDAMPMCDDPKNVTGWQCINRCITNYCKHDDPSRCGGENGYRPEFFEDGNAIVCIGGNCNIDLDNRNNSCCECPEGTTYQNNPESGDTYGGCQGQGKQPGSGCYIGGRMGQSGEGEGHEDGLRRFWVSYSDDSHRWRVDEINYKESEKPPGENYTFGEWLDSTDVKAQASCKAQCVNHGLGAALNADTVQELLTAMQQYYVDNAPSDIKDKNQYAKDQIKKRFIADFCTEESGDHKYKWQPYTESEPHGSDWFGHYPDWACGYMCDGDVENVGPPKIPCGQCGSDC